MRDEGAIGAAVARIVTLMIELGLPPLPPIPSLILGGDGNREVLLGTCRHGGRA